MARSGRPGGAGRRSGAAARRRAAEATPEAMREAMRRLLAPLDAVVLSRERVQEVLDDAVERGRMTRDDAGELLAELVRRGRRQTDDLLRDLEGAVTVPAGRVLREVDRARRASGLGGGFPITGYDELTAAQVAERLDGLSDAQLRMVRDHERRNANRKSVLAAVERRLR